MLLDTNMGEKAQREKHEWSVWTLKFLVVKEKAEHTRKQQRNLPHP